MAKPNKSIYANMNTRMPIASKSVKVEDQGRDAHVDTTSDQTIPF